MLSPQAHVNVGLLPSVSPHHCTFVSNYGGGVTHLKIGPTLLVPKRLRSIMNCHLIAGHILMHAHCVCVKAGQTHTCSIDQQDVQCCGMVKYLTVWSQVWKAVHVSKLMQGGLPGGALLAPSQGPKCEVPSILGSQHSSGLPPLSHTQGNAWPCNITTSSRDTATAWYTHMHALQHILQILA